MSRARAALLGASVAALAAVPLVASGCGDGAGSAQAAAPTPVVPAAKSRPVPSAPVHQGDLVRPGPLTPKVAAAALRGRKTVLVAFLLHGIAEDDAVAYAVRQLQRDPKTRHAVRYLVYRIREKATYGDLADLLNVQETPAVAIIAPDHHLASLWTGPVDDRILSQAIADAQRNAGPLPALPRAVKPKANKPKARPKVTAKVSAKGNPAGLALARRVNRRYATIKGLGAIVVAHDAKKSPIQLRIDAHLRVGRVTAYRARGAVAGRTVSAVGLGGWDYHHAKGEQCWSRSVHSDDTRVIPLTAATFAAPRRVGDVIILRAVDHANAGGPKTGDYRIDAKSLRLLSVITISDPTGVPGDRVTFTDLGAVPEIRRPFPVCGTAAAAARAQKSRGRLTGDPAAIAFMKRYQEATKDAPGVHGTFTYPAHAGVPAYRFDVDMAMAKGKVTGLSGRLVFPTRTALIAGSIERGLFVRPANASCWSRLPQAALDAVKMALSSVPRESRVTGLRAEGRLQVVHVAAGGEEGDLKIDPTTWEARVVQPGKIEGSTRPLRSAPRLTPPTPVCSGHASPEVNLG